MNIWHTDYLVKINQTLYKDVLSTDNISSAEVSKKFKEEDRFGFVLQKDTGLKNIKDKFFVPTELISSLPFIVLTKEKFSHRSDAYWFVSKVRSVKIPSEKRMEFKDLVDTYADYGHSMQQYWTLSKIIMLAAYLERINIRIITEASFGKDSLSDILQLTNGGVANLYKATLAKLKYSLKNDFIVINELGALSPQDVTDMQSYLLQVGAYKPFYENNSRSVDGTKESTDLMRKSHIIFHNPPNYYTDKKQPFFEQMFTAAVMDRFPGLYFQGYVTEDFSVAMVDMSVKEEDFQKIKDVIATINYFKENPPTEEVYTFEENYFPFIGKQKQRSLRTFKTICKYISLYSQSKEEYDTWIMTLKMSYEEYKHIVMGEH